jgi:hypothetical protein
MAAMIPFAGSIDQCLKLYPELRSLTHVFFFCNEESTDAT